MGFDDQVGFGQVAPAAWATAALDLYRIFSKSEVRYLMLLPYRASERPNDHAPMARTMSMARAFSKRGQ